MDAKKKKDSGLIDTIKRRILGGAELTVHIKVSAQL